MRRTSPALLRRVSWVGLVLLLLQPTGRLPAGPGVDSADPSGIVLVCDSSADRVMRLGDIDTSGAVEVGVLGEIAVFYDDSSPGPDLSTPCHMAPGPQGTVYLLDGGTLDSVLALSDRDADGETNGAGEVCVFYDDSTGGPPLSTPNSLVATQDGAYYVSDDGTRTHHILRLSDLDGDGTALGAGEAKIVYDSSAASTPVLMDVESLAAGPDGVLYAGDATLQAIYALRDIDGDGTFLGEGEATTFFQGTQALPVGDIEALLAVDGTIFACGRKSSVLLRIADLDGDGDAMDEGEASAFIDASAILRIQDVTDLAPLPEGGLLLLENGTDTVLFARDLDGDGSALDEGEVSPWLIDGGASLSLPSGIIRLAGEIEPPPVGKTFVRGDSTADGKVDISDSIFTLNFLFLGGITSSCQDALDADDDGQVNISDPIRCLNYLFLGGPAPPPPYPNPGKDPTADSLQC